MKEAATAMSRHMSFLLRHSPEFINESGWASIESITAELSGKAGTVVSEKQVQEIVLEDNKGRYEINGSFVRAVQGHSHVVELGLEARIPPTILFHGTVQSALPSILSQGLLPQSRTHVHLSSSIPTATQVAKRRKGEQILLSIATVEALKAGVEFFQAANGVWLAKSIPAIFISVRS